MKLTKTKLKQIIKEEIKRVLSEGYGNLSPEHIARLATLRGLLSRDIISASLNDALSNYVVGYMSGYGGEDRGIDTSAYDASGGKSTLDPKLASQYQAALGEGHIGRGERGQRRFLDRLVDNHWGKLLQINISELGVPQPLPRLALTFGDALDILAYYGGDAEDYKDSLRSRLDQKLNKPPQKVAGAREKAQDLRSKRHRELGSSRMRKF